MTHIAQPWVLYLLWTVPILAVWLLYMRRRGYALRQRMVSDAMLRRLSAEGTPRRFYLQFGLVITGLLLALLAAAGPHWGYRDEQVWQRGRDLVVALDVSRSMLARDVTPNRLERARADIMDLLRVLRGDRVALLAFRNRAVLLCPLTTDYGYVESVLAEVDVDSAPPGETDLAAALDKVLEAFGDETGAHRAVVMISDGEDLVGRVAESARALAEAGVAVFTVGLGDPDGAPIPDPAAPGGFLMHAGEVVITRLEDAALREIAAVTGGVYIPAGTAHVQLDQLYRDHLRRLAERERDETRLRRPVERYQWFLAPALFCFLIAGLLSRGRPRLKHVPATAGLLVLLALFCRPCPALAADPDAGPDPAAPRAVDESPVPPGRAGAAAARRLYNAGLYRSAAAAWRQAANEAEPRLRATLLFNAARALIDAGEYAAAAGILENLAQGAQPAGEDVMYNLGYAWWHAAAPDDKDAIDPEFWSERIARLEKAGQAFRQAARGRRYEQPARRALEAVAEALTAARARERYEAIRLQYQDAAPFAMADDIMRRQRELVAATAAALTAAPPARVGAMEQLAGEQRDLKDAIGLLGERIADAIDEEDTAPPAALEHYFDAMRTHAGRAYAFLRDADAGALDAARAAAGGIYNLWLDMAPFEALLHEDLLRQTNAMANVQAVMDGADAAAAAQADQAAANELTRLFLERFEEMVPPPPDHPDGLAPDAAGITPEKRANIIELGGQAADRQQQAMTALGGRDWPSALREQHNSHNLLLAIAELLQDDQPPADNGDQSDQEQDAPPDAPDDSSPDERGQDDDAGPRDAESDPPDAEHDEGDAPPADADDAPEPEESEREADDIPAPDDGEPDQVDAQDDAAADEDQEPSLTPEQARRLLEQAAERERDYLRRQRRGYSPPAPTDRDW